MANARLAKGRIDKSVAMRRQLLPGGGASKLLVFGTDSLADTPDVLERIDRDANVSDPSVHKLFLFVQTENTCGEAICEPSWTRLR